MVAGTSTTIKRPLKTILGLANTVVLVQVSFGLTKEPRLWDQNWEIDLRMDQNLFHTSFLEDEPHKKPAILEWKPWEFNGFWP